MAVFQTTNRNVTQEVASGTGTSSVVGNLFVTANLSVAGNATVDQDIAILGNGRVDGDFVVNGNIIYVNIENLEVQDPIISLGRGPNGAPLVLNDGLDRGTEMWYFTTAEHAAFVGRIDSTGNIVSATNVTVSNNIVTVNSYGTFQTGLVYSSNILTTTASVIGNVIGGNLSTVGLITSTGNITGGNILTGGLISASGNITGGNIQATNHTGTTVSVTGNVISENSISSALVQGTTLSASGNVVASNVNVSGTASVTGNITIGNLITVGSVTASILYDYNNTNYYVDPASTSNINNLSVVGRTLVSNGSALFPSLGFFSDENTDTGFFWASNGYIGITNEGTQSGTFGPGTLSLIGNITGGNVLTGGLISSTGNITGGNMSSVGNVTGGNLLGIVRPTAGTGTNGIVFPANPGGGTGDLATIQYYASGGEATVLELTVANDADDIIKLNASGGTSVVGNITAGNVLTNGLISAAGNITTAAYLHGDGSFVSNAAFAGNTIRNGTSNVKVGTLNGNVSMTVGNTSNIVVVTESALSVAGNVNANYFVGDFSGNIIADSISASGNITGGNLLTGGLISVAGNVTAGNILGGANVNAVTHTGTTVSVSANVTAGNILTGGVVSATGNITTSDGITATGNLTAGNISVSGTGAVRTTSVVAGYLTANAASGTALYLPTADANIGGNLSVSGTITSNSNITGSNILTGGLISAASTVTSNSLVGNIVSAVANVVAGNILTGGLISAASTITSDANISAGNILTSGLISAAGSIIGTSLFGNVVSISANVSAGNLLTGGIISAGGNVTGNYIIGNGSQLTGLPAGYANADVAAYLASGNNTSNIITTANVSGTYFIGTATNAQYADLAENYLADADYAPGTVLEFGGTQEVTVSAQDSSKRVAGVVSTAPAHLMNSMLNGANVVSIALVGRVPVSVVGKISKGDLMVSAGHGRARAESNPAVGTVIGKSVENFGGGEGTVEILICMQ